MNEPLRNVLIHLPLIGMVMDHQAKGLVRDLVGAVIIGGIMMYGSVQILGTKIDDLSQEIHQVVATQSDQGTRLRAVERDVAVNGTLLSRHPGVGK